MAGVQIDGVNNKIDFDDDLDTSISSNTDDTLVFEIAGATDFTMTANTFTAASGSTIASQALTALDIINDAISSVTASRGKVGAIQNRLTRSIANLSVSDIAVPEITICTPRHIEL